MSLSGSLTNALSGLNAAARSAEIVSANVANAQTEGYGVRKLGLAAASVGGDGAGVAVTGVIRSADEQLITDRRLAESSTRESSVTLEFFQSFERILGAPGEVGSLTERTIQFETRLIEAASRPDSQARLAAVLDAANGLVSKFNEASRAIQDLREKADQDIDRQVSALNDGLKRIANLNHEIRTQLAAGRDGAALMDQRQQAIDQLAGIVPLQQVARPGGQVALYTSGGAILLDGRPATIGFSPAPTIVPQMTIASGALSGLTIDGKPVSTGQDGPLGGGSLGALFSVRDEHSTLAQSRLDAVARGLVERFADPQVDPTLAATDPGLFTDSGAAFNASNEIGLSGRIAVNAGVDPDLGGALWRLRDGLGASSPGDVGDSGLLTSLKDALRAPRVPTSGSFNGAARSAVELAGDTLSLAHIALQGAEADSSSASARLNALKQAELSNGVDTDQQLQQLLLIEQAYAANARMITTVDQMIQTLLGL